MGIVIVTVVAVIIVAAAAAWFTLEARRRRLRERFGPEYERLARKHDSRRKAEAELSERERRVADLDIRPLSPDARAGYRTEWTAIQERFVETPAEALTAATRLVAAVMRDRGYPTENYDQILADLSVEHAHTLSRFRDAHEISARADANGASTEDMRQAMINYRSLFEELVGVQGSEAGGYGADYETGGYEADARPGAGPGDVRVAGGIARDEQSSAVTAVDDPARQVESQQRSPRR